MFINFETQKWILLFIPALKNTKKGKFCFVFFFGFFLEGGCFFSAVGFLGLAGFVPYICIQGDVKRGSWERRLLPCSALLQSVLKPMIKPMATCPCFPTCPGVWHLVVPEIMRQGFPSLNIQSLQEISYIEKKGFCWFWMSQSRAFFLPA